MHNAYCWIELHQRTFILEAYQHLCRHWFGLFLFSVELTELNHPSGGRARAGA